MVEEHNLLPFRVGQMAESRCFIEGYRGAWFRCKIKQIGLKKGDACYALEYSDFPDEEIELTKLYQKNIGQEDGKRHLMVRPPFPRILKESELLETNTISEVLVVVNDVWKEGDLVDWWTDGCFWSGRVIYVLGNRKVKIELLPPPLGEGQCYDVPCEDLRPSLDWCPINDWTVPTPKEPEKCGPCAQIFRPVKQESPAVLLSSTVLPVDEGTKDVQHKGGSLIKLTCTSFSLVSDGFLSPSNELEHPQANQFPVEHPPLSAANSNGERHGPEIKTDLDAVTTGSVRTSFSESVSSSPVRDAPDALAKAEVENCMCPTSKRARISGSTSLNCMRSDTLEALAMDWEEMLCKVKYLKRILEFGFPPPTPSWKFV